MNVLMPNTAGVHYKTVEIDALKTTVLLITRVLLRSRLEGSHLQLPALRAAQFDLTASSAPTHRLLFSPSARSGSNPQSPVLD